MGFEKGNTLGGRKKGSTNKISVKKLQSKLDKLTGFLESTIHGKYYVYYHVNKVTKEVFYIGKGSGDRAWISRDGCRNDLWSEYVDNNDYSVEIMISNISQEEAIAVESSLIKVKKPSTNLKNI